MNWMEVTLNTKANRSDLDVALSLTGEQADALNVLLGTKANQSDVDAELALKANQTDVALTTEVPSTTDILNNANVGATAVECASTSVNVVNKTSGEGLISTSRYLLEQKETSVNLVSKETQAQLVLGDRAETRAQLVPMDRKETRAQRVQKVPRERKETRGQLVPKDRKETRVQLVWTRTATYPLTVLSRRLGILQRLATDD